MFGGLWGPALGPTADPQMVYDFDVEEKFRAMYDADVAAGANPAAWFSMYGDSAFAESPFLMRAYKGDGIQQWQETHNGMMKPGRVTVENNFAGVVNRYTYLDFKKNLQLFATPVSDYYFAGAFLHNVDACLRRNQTSKKFSCNAPSLHDYLDKANDV